MGSIPAVFVSAVLCHRLDVVISAAASSRVAGYFNFSVCNRAHSRWVNGLVCSSVISISIPEVSCSELTSCCTTTAEIAARFRFPRCRSAAREQRRLGLTRAGMSDIKQYDCLIFDLFGVVIAFDDARVYRRLAQHCADTAAALIGMNELVSDPGLIRGARDLETIRHELVDKFALNLTAEKFERIWIEPYTEPMPGMRQLLRCLSDSYRLVLLSNVDRYYWEVIRCNHSELDHFSTCLLSWEQGVAKPEREAFSRAIAASNTSASRCLFIDDKPENIMAAERMGLAGHIFTGVTGLPAFLLKHISHEPYYAGRDF